MRETFESSCGQGEALIAYFYGEAKPAEARVFERHLEGCGPCRDELAAFGCVRENVREWRATVHSYAPSLASQTVPALTDSHLTSPRPARNSRRALAALREFFTLSPVWLQAGTVAATLLLCALAALALTRAEVRWSSGGLAFNSANQQQPAVGPAATPIAEPSVASRQEIETLEAELAAAREEHEATRAQLRSTEERLQTATAAATSRPAQIETASKNDPPRKRRAASQLAKGERRLSPDRETDDLPSLLDLLGETD